MKKKIALGILILLVLIQFIPVDTTNPTVDTQKDFITVTKAPQEVAQILKTSCYDCHANETAYPWYFKIAPVSWWLKNHINEGRRELNFSTWGDYTTKRKDKKMKECIEMVQEGEMPMWSYTLVHKDGVINEAQQKLLVDWFTTLRTGEAN